MLTGFFSEVVARNDTNPFLSIIFRGFSAEIQPKYRGDRVQTRLLSKRTGQTRSQAPSNIFCAQGGVGESKMVLSGVGKPGGI